VKKRLVPKVSKPDSSVDECVTHRDRTHLSLRFGTPPPTHQSTTHRKALRLSSLPPLPLPLSAIPLSVSKDLVLCKGLLCTNSVNALSLSDKVPDWIIFDKKLASDAEEFDEEDDWKVRMSASCRDSALDVKDVSWDGVMVEVVGKGLSAGTERYHCVLGGKTKEDLFIKVSLVGKMGFGGSLFGMDRGGGAVSGIVFLLPFCFFD
jgi:hypothetical protein